MQRLRFAPTVGRVSLLLFGAAIIVVITIAGVTPTMLISAQGATAAPSAVAATDTPIATPVSTAGSGSPVIGSPISGTAPVGSAIAPPVTGTVEAPSIPVPPAFPPPVATSSGPSSEQVTIAVIGSLIGAAVVALGGWGLIRVIATTGGVSSRR